MGGAHFNLRNALYFGDRIELYEFKSRLSEKTGKYEARWTDIGKFDIYTEHDDISKMPQDVVVETRDIDFLRKLFDAGKEVSWYDPDISEVGNYLGMFDFKRVFLDVFRMTNIITPFGELCPYVDEFGVKFVKSSKRGTNGRYFRMLGIHANDIFARESPYRKILKVKRWKNKKGNRSEKIIIHYYNMVALTYMLWQRSIAANVQNNALTE